MREGTDAGDSAEQVPAAPEPGLRRQGVTGAVWLAARESLGLAIRFGGVLLLARLLGPADYGRYVASVAVVTLLAYAAQLGSEVWLVRRREPPDPHVLAALTGLLLLTSLVAVALSAGLALALTTFIGSRTLAIFLLLLLSLPFNILWAPAQAVLERDLRYRALAGLELAGDVVLYVVALGVAFSGFPLLGAGLGFLLWQMFLLIGSYRLAGLRPAVAWDGVISREVIRFGSRWSAGILLQVAGRLVNPLVVGPMLGAAAVGQVALAQRLMEGMGFAGRGALRVGLTLLAKVRDEPKRLANALDAGTALQTLAVGIPLVAVVLAGPTLVPLVFGDAFTPTVDVLAGVSIAATVAAAFALQTSLLGLRHREGAVAVTYAVLLVLLFVGALTLVPPFGLTGYGSAEALAAMGWLVCDRATRREVARSPGAFTPLAALLPVLTAPAFPLGVRPLLFAPLLVTLLAPRLRTHLVAPVRDLLVVVRGRG